jgi:hypothetical protein
MVWGLGFRVWDYRFRIFRLKLLCFRVYESFGFKFYVLR